MLAEIYEMAKATPEKAPRAKLPLPGEWIEKQNYLPTGFPVFDAEVLKMPGIPSGKIVQLWGEPISGKSLFARMLLAQAQKQDPTKYQLYYCTEFDVMKSQFLDAGIDLSRVTVITENVADDVYETILKFCNDDYNFVCLDSIGNLITQKKMEGDKSPADFARMTAAFSKQFAAKIAKHNLYAVFTNHVTTNIGVMFGDPDVAPGGKIYSHNLNLTLKLRRKNWLKDANDNIVGIETAVRVTKNKSAPLGSTGDDTHIKIYFAGKTLEAEILDYFDMGVRAGFLIVASTTKLVNAEGVELAKFRSQAKAKEAFVANENGVLDTLKELLNESSRTKSEPTSERSSHELSFIEEDSTSDD